MRKAVHTCCSLLASLLALAVTAAAGQGCGPGADGDMVQEGVGTLSEQNRGGDARAPGPAVPCAVTAEGCPCPHDGETIACPGPKIHSGSYTSCAPGHRKCSEGAWGPCIGRVAYPNADASPEE